MVKDDDNGAVMVYFGDLGRKVRSAKEEGQQIS